MRLRVFPGAPSWWEPFETSRAEPDRSDPLANQVEHFAAVIRGEVEPVCSGRDGLASLRVVDAVVESGRTGRPVELPTGATRAR
jgi:predicted dehydrogenase